MNLYNIPNKIKQPAQCCIHCGRSYIKRVNLDKHIVICELLHNSNKKPKTIEEDHMVIPSQQKMFQMLIELGQKYNKLEEKVEEINKWVVKKKKKINVLEWLNANVTPNIVFDSILDKITINDEDLKILMNNNFNDLLNEVFSRTIYKFNETENPIFSFIQKINTFYIYDTIDGKNIWIELTTERLIKFLNKVHMKVLRVFFDWKKTKETDIKSNDSFAIMCDKSMVKLMNVDFKQESILSKVRSAMFNKMKTDMKALIEYDFEF